MSCPRFVENLEATVTSFLNEYELNITDMITYYNKMTGENANGLKAAKYLYHLGDKLISEVSDLDLFLLIRVINVSGDTQETALTSDSSYPRRTASLL